MSDLEKKYQEIRSIIASNVVPYLPSYTRWPDLIALGAADMIIRGLESNGFSFVKNEPPKTPEDK